MMSACGTCGWRGNGRRDGLDHSSSSHDADICARQAEGARVLDNTTMAVNSDLWMCLVCGYVGCGLSNEFHIREHYLETLHAYVVNLDSKRVWDFAGNGYVHRLVMGGRVNGEQDQEEQEHGGLGTWHRTIEEEDSVSRNQEATIATHAPKVVEVPDPGVGSDGNGGNERPLTPSAMGLSSMEEEALIHRNLEHVAETYRDCLLESMRLRRRDYDEQVKKIRRFSRNIELPKGDHGDNCGSSSDQEKDSKSSKKDPHRHKRKGRQRQRTRRWERDNENEGLHTRPIPGQSHCWIL